MKRYSITGIAALAALLLAVVAGCDTEDKKNYDVTIAWNIAGGQGTTCSQTLNGPGVSEQVEFDKVLITVYDAEGDVEPIQDPVEVDCADYEYTIPRLGRGKYWVTVGAMAEFEGDYLPYYEAEGEIRAPDRDEIVEFVLLQGKGKIAVSWSFDNNKFCGPNDVSDVEISLTGDEVECETGEFIIEDLVWAEYSITVEGMDDDGETTWIGDCAENPFEVKPGQVYEAHVELSEF